MNGEIKNCGQKLHLYWFWLHIFKDSSNDRFIEMEKGKNATFVETAWYI